MENPASEDQAPEEPDSEECRDELKPLPLDRLIQSIDRHTDSVDNLAIMIGKLITKMEEGFNFWLIFEETEKQVRENERREKDRRQFWGKPRGR